MDTSRIVALAKKQGKSITYLCGLIGRYRGYMKDISKASSAMPMEYLQIIAADLGTTPEYLLFETDNPSVMMSDSNVRGFSVERSVVQIKVYGTIPAGVPVEAVEDIIDTEEIPASWLSGDREYFALQVHGDSMYPQYLEGDVVIFLKTDTCETGDDCVVYVNGQDATLKRIKRYEDGSLSLCPLNTSYSPCTFTAKQVQELPVTIGGVAVELRRKFRTR
jgi:repressor LexA